MSTIGFRVIAGLAAGVVLAGGGAAQVLGGVGGVQLPPASLPTGNVPVLGPVVEPLLQPLIGQGVDPVEDERTVRQTLDSVGGVPQQLAEAGPTTLREVRTMRLRELVRLHHNQLESDGDGQPVRRGVMVAINPDPASLELAIRAGFKVVADDRVAELGLRTVTLRPPKGDSAREGLRRLQRVAPRLEADFDHVYEPAGGALLPVAAALAAADGPASGRTIGMVDGGVASHPALAGARIEQRGFSGKAAATGHGTAVASLVVGRDGAFRGAGAGATLLVADVYGGNQAAGSATAIVKALAWLSANRPAVINISLVGPANRLVARAIEIVRQRGQQVVAAVGNDGPAAPPQYPASYPGVIAVTAVDGKGRALPEAGRAPRLDFAAPGADMAAASPGAGYAKVRGTSFAAPLVASRLAIRGSAEALAQEARPGRGKVGRGVVCGECRTDPRAVRAR